MYFNALELSHSGFNVPKDMEVSYRKMRMEAISTLGCYLASGNTLTGFLER